VLKFQSTRPQGARQAIRICAFTSVSCFNPRARRGRDLSLMADDFREIGFNPRARRGRDKAKSTTSTATVCFNPRARRGRDVMSRSGTTRSKSFNPRARRGRDLHHGSSGEGFGYVSIHAPAGGATVSLRVVFFDRYRFNPRARRGRDH